MTAYIRTWTYEQSLYVAAMHLNTLLSTLGIFYIFYCQKEVYGHSKPGSTQSETNFCNDKACVMQSENDLLLGQTH